MKSRPQTTSLKRPPQPAPTDVSGASIPAAQMAVSYSMVQQAAQATAGVLPPTPLWNYPVIDDQTGHRVFIKHENAQPTGAFKVRGGIALAATLTSEQKSRGVITASMGNHAQSIAYAAARGGFRAVIVLPSRAPACKVAAVRALGAHAVIAGDTMSEACEKAREMAQCDGLTYVDPADPWIVAGHALVYKEMLEAQPDLEAIYVPVGSGSGAAGACIVRDALAPECRIIGVQSAQACAAHDSWRSGALVERDASTRATGLAVGRGYALPQQILFGRLDDFILVDDDQIYDAAAVLARDAHTLAEGAGAASLAGFLADPKKPGTCGVVVTGGNADSEEIAQIAGLLQG